MTLEIATLELSQFASWTIDRMLTMCQHANTVKVRLRDTAPRIDLLHIIEFASALNLAHKTLVLEDLFNEFPKDPVNGQFRADVLLLSWFAQKSPNVERLGVVYPNCVIIPPTLLPLSTRFSFVSEFERTLASASMRIEAKPLATTSLIAFEAAMNAEEHGSARVNDKIFSEALLLATIRATPFDCWPLEARDYLESYVNAGHSQPERWIEIIVSDNGAGITYPSFREIARRSGRTTDNVNDATFDEERSRLQILLNSDESTKGRWGRVLNSETPFGEGKRLIKFHLQAVRGFAGLRSGRTFSSYWFAKATRTPSDLKDASDYEVKAQACQFFQGTAWRILIPLDQQIGFAF